MNETQIDSKAPTRVYVCVTCRSATDTGAPGETRAGTRLYEALSAACRDDDAIEVLPVECLSVCKRPCTVSFAAAGKWTYVYGDLPPETGAGLIRHAAQLYGDAADGLIPWKLRPDPIKRGVISRVPPLPFV